jgi:hypothetical protein
MISSQHITRQIQPTPKNGAADLRRWASALEKFVGLQGVGSTLSKFAKQTLAANGIRSPSTVRNGREPALQKALAERRLLARSGTSILEIAYPKAALLVIGDG